MRGILLSLMVVFAMTGVALGEVTLSAVMTEVNPSPGSGLRTFKVTATGVGINVLHEFEVVGDVHQVFTGTGQITEWINNKNGNTVANPLDSHVLFGENTDPITVNRLPDLANTAATPGPGWGGYAAYQTTETVTGGGNSGLGTLKNLHVGTEGQPGYAPADAYHLLGTPTGDVVDVDLFQLVIPQGDTVTLNVTLFSALYSNDTGWFTDIVEYNETIDVYSPWNGDANLDGSVSLADLSAFAQGWNGVQPASWATGDFNLDGEITLADLSLFAQGWNGPAGPGGGAGEGAGAAPVPEPSSILMLVLGSLCLAGYRLRK